MNQNVVLLYFFGVYFYRSNVVGSFNYFDFFACKRFKRHKTLYISLNTVLLLQQTCLANFFFFAPSSKLYFLSPLSQLSTYIDYTYSIVIKKQTNGERTFSFLGHKNRFRPDYLSVPDARKFIFFDGVNFGGKVWQQTL